MHLIFLIHGLFGNPKHMDSMLHSLEERAKQQKLDVHVYVAQTIATTRTFDGIQHNAERLYLEILQVMTDINATEVSIIGYSMGGLCARVLVGLLYEEGILNKVSPKVFATFATPHLGSYYYLPEDVSFWSSKYLFSNVFNLLAPLVTGPSGFDLFRKNGNLNKLASFESNSMKGLKKFKTLLLFANGTKDRTVHFWTSFITDRNPFYYIHQGKEDSDVYIENRSDVSDQRSSTMSIKTYVGFPMFVDLKTSLYGESHQSEVSAPTSLKTILIRPFIFVILLLGLSSVSTLAWIKLGWRHITGHLTKSKVQKQLLREKFIDKLQDIVESTLNEQESDNEELVKVTSTELGSEIECALSPGYAGFVESCPNIMDLTDETLENIQNLNSLPWRKFAIALEEGNAHAGIIDRIEKNKNGKKIMNYLAYYVFNQC